MQKRRILLVLFFSFYTLFLQAQFDISGVILDSASREPLSKASVFCQNTTLGTLTNKEGAFNLSLKSGGYDLVFSYTGYHTQTIRVREQQKLEVLLVKKDNSMEEVVLKSSFEVADGWQKYGDFFMEHFIGSTPNAEQCVLNNPEVLKFFFYKKTNRLKVMSPDALQISNPALGYELRYQLDSFVYYYNNSINSYRGYCLFMEMEGSDSLKQQWSKARENAYYGSRLHFMHSYYDSTLLEDGFVLSLLDSTKNKKFNKISNPYDQIEIWYPRKISVMYTKKNAEPEYQKKMNLPKNVAFATSYIDIKDTIVITENGYYYDQKDWINQGYWSWKNLADLLPYDYMPD